MSTILDAAKTLPLPERIKLAEALWENIALDGYEPELTAAQAAELDRRLAAHQKAHDDVVPWETVRAELEKKFERER
jgi:putative addiction module component (TIGR02574 family)